MLNHVVMRPGSLYALAPSLVALVLSGVNVGDAAGAGAVSIRTVALSGEPAPGTDETFEHLSLVIIDSAGRAALRAQISGDSSGPCDELGDPPPEQGIWSEASGVLELVARRGAHAPGTDPLVTFNGFDTPLLNTNGRSAFLGFLSGVEADGDCANAGNNAGVWSEGPGVLSLVALAGSAAPGTPAGVVFDGFANVRLNGAGRTAFGGFLDGPDVDPTNSRGIWSEGSGTLALVARSGAEAPGTDPGVAFDWFGSGSPVLNGLGDTAFRAALVGPGVDDTNSYGIWAETAGTPTLVVRGGTPAPGTEEGVVFHWLGSPRLNDAGELAFLSTLAGPGVDESNDLGIWTGAAGSLALVARTGSPAPGTAGVFTDLGDPALNDDGQVAFRGFAGPGASGVWSQESGELALVARLGDPAPGAGDGVSFAGFGHPAFNGAAHTAFRGVLSGAGVAGGNDTGLWAEDPAGKLTLVVREGNLLEVSPGEFRTVTLLDLVAGSAEGGTATALNDAGQVAFGSSFTDGSSGAFVASFCSSADLSGDCRVGIADLLELLAGWGPCAEPPAPCPGDLDGDGAVTIADLLLLLADWG